MVRTRETDTLSGLLLSKLFCTPSEKGSILKGKNVKVCHVHPVPFRCLNVLGKYCNFCIFGKSISTAGKCMLCISVNIMRIQNLHFC